MLTNKNGLPVWTYEGDAPEVGKVYRFKASNGVTYYGKPIAVDEAAQTVTFNKLTARK